MSVGCDSQSTVGPARRLLDATSLLPDLNSRQAELRLYRVGHMLTKRIVIKVTYIPSLPINIVLKKNIFF
jgi:hypothetical protein